MFRKMLSFVKSFGRRIRKSVVNFASKIKRFVTDACQRVMKTPVLAAACGIALTAAAIAVVLPIGSIKLIKSVIVSGFTFTSGLAVIAWRNKKNVDDYNELREYCDELEAEEA